MRDPFHDLHHHETGSTSHIRLISEGGGAHPRNPEMACIDSIQATQPCITEAQHAVYAPSGAGGNAVPENSLCSIPAEHAAELDRASVPNLLRERLQLIGVRLGPGAAVSVREPGAVWHLDDEDHSYSVRRRTACLAVYAEG